MGRSELQDFLWLAPFRRAGRVRQPVTGLRGGFWSDHGGVSGNLRAVESPRNDDRTLPKGTGRVEIGRSAGSVAVATANGLALIASKGPRPREGLPATARQPPSRAVRGRVSRAGRRAGLATLLWLSQPTPRNTRRGWRGVASPPLRSPPNPRSSGDARPTPSGAVWKAFRFDEPVVFSRDLPDADTVESGDSRLGRFVASGIGLVSPKEESLFYPKRESPAGTLDLAFAQQADQLHRFFFSGRKSYSFLAERFRGCVDTAVTSHLVEESCQEWSFRPRIHDVLPFLAPDTAVEEVSVVDRQAHNQGQFGMRFCFFRARCRRPRRWRRGHLWNRLGAAQQSAFHSGEALLVVPTKVPHGHHTHRDHHKPPNAERGDFSGQELEYAIHPCMLATIPLARQSAARAYRASSFACS